MSTTAIALTGPDALALVAAAPDISGKTPADLRAAAKELEEASKRKDRLVLADASGRQRARSKAREREADKLHQQAEVIRLAAAEVENRECATVGEASRHPLVRKVRRAMGGKR